MRNRGRPLWLLIFGKWFYFELVGLVFPCCLFSENLARALSPATLGHRRLRCCLCCCGAAVVVFMVVVLLLSRLCEDEALSRTQQA